MTKVAMIEKGDICERNTGSLDLEPSVLSIEQSLKLFTMLQWSYGILLWELVTRGSLPYPGVANSGVKQLLESGRRLDKPNYVNDTV